VGFTVDPGFLSYTTVPIKITAVLKKTGDKSAGFNFKYESTVGFKGGLGWWNVPAGAEWVTQSWTIKDPQFVGKFGYHFSFDGDSAQHGNYLLKSVVVEKE
jgi:polysaccharide biosynthesis protein PslG